MAVEIRLTNNPPVVRPAPAADTLALLMAAHAACPAGYAFRLEEPEGEGRGFQIVAYDVLNGRAGYVARRLSIDF